MELLSWWHTELSWESLRPRVPMLRIKGGGTGSRKYEFLSYEW